MKRIVSLLLCITMLATFAVFASAYDGENYVVFSENSKVDIPKNQHIRGDSNGDGVVGMIDIIASLKYICGDTSASLRDSVDTNSDGTVDVTDALLIIRYILGDSNSLGELVE